MKSIAVLGSTGSVGQSTLAIIDKHPESFRVEALVAGKNHALLAEQIKRHRPRVVSMHDSVALKKLKASLGTATTSVECLEGAQGALDIARMSVDLVVCGIVGVAGLGPCMQAIESGNDVAIANKEAYVVAGHLINAAVKKANVNMFPIDSEHNALFQILDARSIEEGDISSLILTASGGPFFMHPDQDLEKITVTQALKHPKWSMGPKISIDSATMMNKALEVIEAHWIFSCPEERIQVWVHPESLVHGMVQLKDGSTFAHMARPDMALPIAHALAYPARLDGQVQVLNVADMNRLQFFPPDHVRFRALNLARHALRSGPAYPAVLNGANEWAVDAFLNKRIGFLDIVSAVDHALQSYGGSEATAIDDMIRADAEGRRHAEERFGLN